MHAGRFAGIFAERPTEWIAVSIVHMYTCTCTRSALCGYTRHLRTCRYAAMHVNRLRLRLRLQLRLQRSTVPKGLINLTKANLFPLTQVIKTPHTMVLPTLKLYHPCFSPSYRQFLQSFVGKFVKFSLKKQNQ